MNDDKGTPMFAADLKPGMRVRRMKAECESTEHPIFTVVDIRPYSSGNGFAMLGTLDDGMPHHESPGRETAFINYGETPEVVFAAPRGFAPWHLEVLGLITPHVWSTQYYWSQENRQRDAERHLNAGLSVRYSPPVLEPKKYKLRAVKNGSSRPLPAYSTTGERLRKASDLLKDGYAVTYLD